jgi:hypothetical protein
MTTEREHLLLSAQVALLGAISDPVLAVSVDIQHHELEMAVFVEGNLTADERDALEEAGTEFYAAFGVKARTVEVRFVENPQLPLRGRGYWVFVRFGCRVASTMESPSQDG